MAWFSSMLGLLPAVVLVFAVLSGTEGSGDQAVAGSEPTLGISGRWEGRREMWVAKGDSVVLPCLVGEGAPTTTHGPPHAAPHHPWRKYTWKRDNQTMDDRRRHLVDDQGYLNITKVRRGRDEGEYRCLVTTHEGTLTSPPISLNIASLIKSFSSGPHNVTVVAGETVRLQCQIQSQPPAALAWTRDANPLPQSHRYTSLNSGAIHINEVQKSDAGMYRCQATNAIANKKRTSDGMYVYVVDAAPDYQRAPSFLSPRDPVVAVQGKDAVLECVATGVPPPTISWRRKLKDSSGWEDVRVGVAGVSVIGQGSLVLSRVHHSARGVYACVAANNNATNNRQNTISQEIELDILTPPEIVDPPKPLESIVAKIAILNCTVSGHPKPRVTWFKDGRLAYVNGRIVQSDSDQLWNYNSVSADKGLYQCLAVNEAGYASSWAIMEIKSSMNQPDPPQNLHSVVLSSTSVLLEWDPVKPTSDNITAYSVHYIATATEGKGIETQLVVKNTTLLLDNLRPNTHYIAEVRAYTNVPSDMSEKVVFKTDESVPLGVPNVQLVSISSTVLKVRWDPLPPDQAQGTIMGYKIQWRKPSSHYYHVEEVSADVREHTISDLHPGKRYEVQVLAGTKAGYPTKDNYPWIGHRMNEPSQDTPLPPLLSLKVTNASQGRFGVKVEWQMPSDNIVDVTGYRLRLRPQAQSWEPPLSFPASQHSYTIPALDGGWYEVEVLAESSNGDGKATHSSINTAAPKPGPTTATTTTAAFANATCILEKVSSGICRCFRDADGLLHWCCHESPGGLGPLWDWLVPHAIRNESKRRRRIHANQTSLVRPTAPPEPEIIAGEGSLPDGGGHYSHENEDEDYPAELDIVVFP